MKQGYIINSVVIFVCLSITAFAQQTVSFESLKPIYEKIERYYNNDYAIRTEMYSYKGHQNTVHEDQSKGFVIKKGSVIEALQLGIYSIQDNKIKVLIDSSEKLVALTYPDTTSNLNFENYKQHNRLKLIEKITLQSLRNSSVIDFYYKKTYQYERVTLVVNEMGLIEEISMYFSNELSYEAPDGTVKKAKAKVKMLFKEENVRERKFTLKIQDIVISSNKGYQPSEAFKKFEFIDFRYQN